MTTFTPTEIDEIIHAAFDFVFQANLGMQLPAMQLKAAKRCCPWLGLGEMSTFQPPEIFDIFARLDAAEVENEDTVDKWTRELAEADLAKAKDEPVAETRCHHLRLLLKQPKLIPFINVMAQKEKWDFDAKIKTPGNSISLPSLQCKNNQMPVAIPKTSQPSASSTGESAKPDRQPRFQHPRVDLAIIHQLTQRLHNPGNINSWRIYTSVLGVRIMAAMDPKNLHHLFSDGVVTNFEYQRYAFEEHHRRLRESAKLETKSKAEAEAARKAKEKIAVLEAVINSSPKP